MSHDEVVVVFRVDLVRQSIQDAFGRDFFHGRPYQQINTRGVGLNC
jgi:hypothetical protein